MFGIPDDGEVLSELARACIPFPKGPKDHNRVFRVSILGTVTMVLGRYLLFGYLGTWTLRVFGQSTKIPKLNVLRNWRHRILTPRVTPQCTSSKGLRWSRLDLWFGLF